ncbi:MAG: hypothetical protein U0Z26_10735 [Anaerolineales bacterium]
MLGAKSKTQQLAGAYVVAPPPAESDLPEEEPSEGATLVDKEPRQLTGPVPAPAPHEDQPFVSPLKKQKERERKRRVAIIRFIFILVILLLAAVPFVAPNFLPAEMRNLIFPLTRTATPTKTASPLPTETVEATQTVTPLPTATKTLIFTPTPFATNLVVPVATEIPATATFTATTTPTEEVPTATVTTTAVATPVGGEGQIAYVSNRSGLPQIYLLDISTQTVVQITNVPEGACQPSWAPDGTKLVFISPCKGMDEIYYKASLYIINADGSNLIPIATVPGGDFDPSWSPDGKTITFTSLRTGQMELFTIDVKAQIVTQITKGVSGVESREPSWSPDGSKIVYAVKRLGVYQIWLMNNDGTDAKQIVRSGTKFIDYLPTWSKDGSLIIFNQRCANTFCFPYAMSISSTDRSVTQGSVLQFNVVSIEDMEYSPDGFWLVFEGEEAGQNKDISYMTVTGANRVRLTFDQGMDFDPTWRPAIK